VRTVARGLDAHVVHALHLVVHAAQRLHTRRAHTGAPAVTPRKSKCTRAKKLFAHARACACARASMLVSAYLRATSAASASATAKSDNKFCAVHTQHSHAR
jgi:hypothetical protein